MAEQNPAQLEALMRLKQLHSHYSSFCDPLKILGLTAMQAESMSDGLFVHLQGDACAGEQAPCFCPWLLPR